MDWVIINNAVANLCSAGCVSFWGDECKVKHYLIVIICIYIKLNNIILNIHIKWYTYG